jgi:ABC-type transport system involved in multi-copper enzyme maturation permease subunit
VPRYVVRCAVFSTLLVVPAVLSAAGVFGFGIPWPFETAAALGVLLLCASAGGGAIVGERERRTLAALLVTPLPARAIVLGKARTSFLSLAALLVPLFAFVGLLASILDAREGWLVVWAVAGAALLAFLGALAASVRARTPLRAAAAGLVVVAATFCAAMPLARAGAVAFLAASAVVLAGASVLLFDRALGRAA